MRVGDRKQCLWTGRGLTRTNLRRNVDIFDNRTHLENLEPVGNAGWATPALRGSGSSVSFWWQYTTMQANTAAQRTGGVYSGTLFAFAAASAISFASLSDSLCAGGAARTSSPSFSIPGAATCSGTCATSTAGGLSVSAGAGAATGGVFAEGVPSNFGGGAGRFDTIWEGPGAAKPLGGGGGIPSPISQL